MNLLLPLLLSHFIADFPLQNNKIVGLKHQKIYGVLLHALIHLAVMSAILFPFFQVQRVWIGVLTVFLAHVIIDHAKVYLDSRYPHWHPLYLYFGDQFFHLLTIFLVTYFWIGQVHLAPETITYYMGNPIALYLLVAILATYFYDVTRWFWKNEGRAKKQHYPYRRDYRMMLRNLLLITAIFGVIWWVF